MHSRTLVAVMDVAHETHPGSPTPRRGPEPRLPNRTATVDVHVLREHRDCASRAACHDPSRSGETAAPSSVPPRRTEPDPHARSDQDLAIQTTTWQGRVRDSIRAFVDSARGDGAWHGWCAHRPDSSGGLEWFAKLVRLGGGISGPPLWSGSRPVRNSKALRRLSLSFG